MDWSKVDAGLAGALADPGTGERYVVFVHLNPSSDPEALASLPGDPVGEGAVRTATVSAEELERLSERAEVSHLALSRAVGLTGPA